MPNTISLQPGQPGEGMNYNVHKPLPYPSHVDADTGDVRPGPQTGNAAGRLIGFQPDVDTQRVDLWREVFVVDSQKAGMVPVFVDATGGMFSLDVPVLKVADNRPKTELTPTHTEPDQFADADTDKEN